MASHQNAKDTFSILNRCVNLKLSSCNMFWVLEIKLHEFKIEQKQALHELNAIKTNLKIFASEFQMQVTGKVIKYPHLNKRKFSNID